MDQTGVAGGHAVAEKRVDLHYNIVGEVDRIVRYKDTDGGDANEVMTSVYTPDKLGQLTALGYTHHGTPPVPVRSFGWGYDAVGRVTSHDSDIAAEDVGAQGYGYDDTDQVTSTNYTVYDAFNHRIASRRGRRRKCKPPFPLLAPVKNA